jgi:hypothetical protein
MREEIGIINLCVNDCQDFEGVAMATMRSVIRPGENGKAVNVCHSHMKGPQPPRQRGYAGLSEWDMIYHVNSIENILKKYLVNN